MEQSESISEVTPYEEQSDSTGGVTPYELATLASRICPKSCASDPKEAIAVAERLLKEADAAIDRAYQEERDKEWDEYRARGPRTKWVEALKQITGQKRRDRAEKRFLQFVRPWERRSLEVRKRDGFTPHDVDYYQRRFTSWLKEPKRKKGKQGRRISESDRRLRTELVGLVPQKPR